MISNRWGFSRWRNVDNDSADVTSAGRSFQIRGPTTGKARLVTIDNLTGGTTRRQCQKNEELDGQAGQRRGRMDRGIAARVRARLCYLCKINEMPEFYVIIARKIFFPNFGGHVPPFGLPSRTTMARSLMPNTHRRRRRGETVELRRVGVGGVYMNSQLDHDDCRRIR